MKAELSSFKESMVKDLKKKVIGRAVSAIGGASDSKLVLITHLVEGITPEKHKAKVRRIRELIRQKHPALKYIRRWLTEYDERCVRKFIENLVVEGVVLNGGPRWDAAQRGEGAPFTVLVSPSMRCNLRCIGCYADKYDRKDDMSIELLDRIIREGKELKAAYFTFLGGEPFIRQDIFDMFTKHSDAYFVVYTNGTLVNDALCDKIKKAGNVMPILSIEGFEKETDGRRGRGVYKSVVEAMNLLGKHKIPFGYSVCVTSKNQKIVYSEKFIDMLIKEGALIGWYFLYMPVCGAPDMALMPSPKQRLNMLKRLREIRATKPIFLVDFWNDAPYVGGCIAGKSYVHITSSGDVEPCIFTHFSTSNIKDQSLGECINSEYFRELRKRQPYHKNLFLPCQWIDHPEVSREMHAKFNLKPTHPGAEDILINAGLRAKLDKYSSEVKKIYEKEWKDFQKKRKI